MNNKQIWIGLFVSGMLLGALIAWATLFLNERLGTQSRMTPREAARIFEQRESGTPPTIPGIILDKNLCEVLSKEDINSLLPGLNLIASLNDLPGPAANCSYIRADGEFPVLNFNHNFPDLRVIEDQQRQLGATLKRISGVGDEAIFANIPAVPNSNLLLRAIFFRVGDLGYSVSSFELAENQLRVVAEAAVEKLR